MLTPAALTARAARRPAGASSRPTVSREEEEEAPKKAKEEYLKAAPGTGPSGPTK